VRECGVGVRVGARVGHGQKEGLLVPELEVLVGKLFSVDGLAASALSRVSNASHVNMSCLLTLPRVKSPPWSIKSGMTRWNLEPAYPKPFSPVERARKFSTVLGTTSSKSSKLMRPCCSTCVGC
jgi:hypothetical protein